METPSLLEPASLVMIKSLQRDISTLKSHMVSFKYLLEVQRGHFSFLVSSPINHLTTPRVNFWRGPILRRKLQDNETVMQLWLRSLKLALLSTPHSKMRLTHCCISINKSNNVIYNIAVKEALFSAEQVLLLFVLYVHFADN